MKETRKTIILGPVCAQSREHTAGRQDREAPNFRQGPHAITLSDFMHHVSSGAQAATIVATVMCTKDIERTQSVIG